MSEMVFGQLYRLGFTGFSSANMEVKKVEYLVVGTSIDDVKTRFPYLVDLSEFDRYRIEYCAKEPSRAFVLSTKLEKTTENKPDVVVERAFGTDAFWQNVKNDNKAKKYSVVARTTCFAFSEKSAKNKLSERIKSLSDHVEVVCEELFGGDGFAKPKDMSMFTKATFVRG